MSGFVGEYECKLDGKGRFLMPSNLRKQIDAEYSIDSNKFVLNRGFEGCLVLYPIIEWNKEVSQLKKLNLYVSKNRKFYRQFHNGATQSNLDGTNRLLIPKQLVNVAEIKSSIILFAYANRIEIWAKNKYNEEMKSDAEDFENLAEDVMSTLNEKENNNE